MDWLKVRTVECVSFGLTFYFMAVNNKPFSTPTTPLSLCLSLSIDLYVPSSNVTHSVMMEIFFFFFLLWTPDFSDKRGVKTLQHLEKQSRFRDRFALRHKLSLQQCISFFFFLFLSFFSHIEKHECCGGWTLQKANVFDFNVIFVTIEVYIFIRIFGLYSDPVTDCTFVGNVLSSSPQQNPPTCPSEVRADI